MQLRGTGDRHDPGFLSQQPGERDLRGRRALPLGDSLTPVILNARCRLLTIRDPEPVLAFAKQVIQCAKFFEFARTDFRKLSLKL